MVSRACVITNRTCGCCGLGPAIAALLAIAVAAPAMAQSPPQPEAVRANLTVDADADCATAAALAERVQERSQRIGFVDDTGDIPRLRVTIGASSARDRVAMLFIRWPDGRSAERRLTAGSCPSALDALALLVAMTLDPAASSGGDSPAASSGGDSPDA